MQLFLQGVQTPSIAVAPTATVLEVKETIFNSEGIPCDEQVLSYAGRPLESDNTVEFYGINDLSTVSVDVRLLGGKVHGSLARAGKVKGQTPKVDKQEKVKKDLNGRAKRRKQYNKRFVNVTPTFGKKRGPNSNAKL